MNSRHLFSIYSEINNQEEQIKFYLREYIKKLFPLHVSKSDYMKNMSHTEKTAQYEKYEKKSIKKSIKKGNI